MVRRWSCLVKWDLNPSPASRNLIRVRKTRDYVRLRYYSFFPTWFLIKKQSLWLLRHEQRRLFSLFIDSIILMLYRGTLFRFTESFFSLQQSQSIFWSWKGRQEHFFSTEEGTMVTTHINPRINKFVKLNNWLYNSPRRIFVLGDIHNLIEDDNHDLGLTILKTSAEPDYYNANDFPSIFANLDEYIFGVTKDTLVIYYQITMLATLAIANLTKKVL